MLTASTSFFRTIRLFTQKCSYMLLVCSLLWSIFSGLQVIFFSRHTSAGTTLNSAYNKKKNMRRFCFVIAGFSLRMTYL